MGRKRQYLFPKRLEESLQRLTLEYESLPENFPTPQGVFLKVVRQFKALGIEPEPMNRGPIAEMMIEESNIRWRAIVCHFGKYAEKPFVTKAAMKAAGKWVKQNPKAKAAKLPEVQAAILSIIHRVTVEKYAELSQKKIAELIFKEIGKTTTDKTIRQCRAHKEAKKIAWAEKTARAKKLIETSD